MVIRAISLRDFLNSKTTIGLYNQIINKGIKPISTEIIKDYENKYLGNSKFFKNQINQNLDLFNNFRHTPKGEKVRFNIPLLSSPNLDFEYLYLEHNAGHKMEFCQGYHYKLTLTKPFYFQEEINIWRGGDYNNSSICFLEPIQDGDNKDKKNDKTKIFNFENLNLEIKHSYYNSNPKVKLKGSYELLDEKLPNLKPIFIQNLEYYLEQFYNR